MQVERFLTDWESVCFYIFGLRDSSLTDNHHIPTYLDSGVLYYLGKNVLLHIYVHIVCSLLTEN